MVPIASFRPFAAVAVAAEHLAVGGDGPPSVAPRRDVVGLHLGKLEVRPAQGADPVLSSGCVSRTRLKAASPCRSADGSSAPCLYVLHSKPLGEAMPDRRIECSVKHSLNIFVRNLVMAHTSPAYERPCLVIAHTSATLFDTAAASVDG